MLYKDRYDAGRKLAESLYHFKPEKPLILALPRGGVVIGYEISKTLKAPLVVFVARKIGVPFYPELGIGAIAPNGIQILDNELIHSLNIPEKEIQKIIELETVELQRRLDTYREGMPPLELKGKTVILVDDGLATGVSAKASILSIKKLNPKKIILAVPVSPPNTALELQKEVDVFLCLHEPKDFYAVSAYYENFNQVSDNEVINLLNKAKRNINFD